jgi:hypothetical protein
MPGNMVGNLYLPSTSRSDLMIVISTDRKADGVDERGCGLDHRCAEEKQCMLDLSPNSNED